MRLLSIVSLNNREVERRGEEGGGSDVAHKWGLPPWWKWTQVNFNSHLSPDSADANQTVWIASTREANTPKIFTDLLLVDETFFFECFSCCDH